MFDIKKSKQSKNITKLILKEKKQKQGKIHIGCHSKLTTLLGFFSSYFL